MTAWHGLARPALDHARRVVGEELTVRLARDRYKALARLREEHDGADRFSVRMLGRRALVVRGEDGVRTFYDPSLVTRRAAVPAPIRLVLFGPGAVHGLDGEAHARRKRLLLQLVDERATERLSAAVAERLDTASARWREQERVRLFDELVELYGSAALAWAGTGTTGEEASAVSRELAAIVDGFGIGGTPYPRAALARARAHRWAVKVVRQARDGHRTAPAGSPVAVLAATPRRELPDLVAASELLNLVRPTVAVAYYGAYAAQALSSRPDWRSALAAGSAEHLRAFELEVRRWYPFTPLLTGRLRGDFRWGDRHFVEGDWLVLDVIGTNRDPKLWERADDFLPERFLGRQPTAHDYVPHGGGDPASGHRCPGEPVTEGVLGTTLRSLAALPYMLGGQATRVPLDRIPSLPPDGMTLHVRATGTG